MQPRFDCRREAERLFLFVSSGSQVLNEEIVRRKTEGKRKYI